MFWIREIDHIRPGMAIGLCQLKVPSMNLSAQRYGADRRLGHINPDDPSHGLDHQPKFSHVTKGGQTSQFSERRTSGTYIPSSRRKQPTRCSFALCSCVIWRILDTRGRQSNPFQASRYIRWGCLWCSSRDLQAGPLQRLVGTYSTLTQRHD